MESILEQMDPKSREKALGYNGYGMTLIELFPDMDPDDRNRLHRAILERRFRDRNVSWMSQELQRSRVQNLDLLHEYWVKGELPKNRDFPGEHVPYFIDQEGVACAVAYMVIESGFRKEAEAIASRENFAWVKDIKSPELDVWIAQSGLAKEECAMVQMPYVYVDPPIPCPPAPAQGPAFKTFLFHDPEDPSNLQIKAVASEVVQDVRAEISVKGSEDPIYVDLTGKLILRAQDFESFGMTGWGSTMGEEQIMRLTDPEKVGVRITFLAEHDMTQDLIALGGEDILNEGPFESWGRGGGGWLIWEPPTTGTPTMTPTLTPTPDPSTWPLLFRATVPLENILTLAGSSGVSILFAGDDVLDQDFLMSGRMYEYCGDTEFVACFRSPVHYDDIVKIVIRGRDDSGFEGATEGSFQHLNIKNVPGNVFGLNTASSDEYSKLDWRLKTIFAARYESSEDGLSGETYSFCDSGPTPIPTRELIFWGTQTLTPVETLEVLLSTTPTPTASPSMTRTHTPSFTSTPTQTFTNTLTASPSITPTPTPSFTSTPTQTFTNTPTVSLTRTPTHTPSFTSTFTATPIPTRTPTPSSTWTSTLTPSPMPTSTPTPTSTATPVPTATCAAVIPTFEVVAIYDPDVTDMIEIKVIASAPIENNQLSAVEVRPQSVSHPVADVTASFVYQGNNTFVGQYKRSEGFGDIAAIVVTAVNPCGLDAVSDGRFERQVRPSKSRVVILNSVFDPTHGEKTGILVSLQITSNVHITIHDRRGRMVRNLLDEVRQGSFQVDWEGVNEEGSLVSSGIYIVTVRTRKFTETRKVVVKK